MLCTFSWIISGIPLFFGAAARCKVAWINYIVQWKPWYDNGIKTCSSWTATWDTWSQKKSWVKPKQISLEVSWFVLVVEGCYFWNFSVGEGGGWSILRRKTCVEGSCILAACLICKCDCLDMLHMWIIRVGSCWGFQSSMGICWVPPQGRDWFQQVAGCKTCVCVCVSEERSINASSETFRRTRVKAWFGWIPGTCGWQSMWPLAWWWWMSLTHVTSSYFA